MSSESRLVASLASHISWANTADRSARTAPARAALDQKFLDQAAGDPVRAEHLRKAYYKRLALKSAQARRKIKDLTAEAEQAEAALASGPPGDDQETQAFLRANGENWDASRDKLARGTGRSHPRSGDAA